jgi:hypothetical protein
MRTRKAPPNTPSVGDLIVFAECEVMTPDVPNVGSDPYRPGNFCADSLR